MHAMVGHLCYNVASVGGLHPPALADINERRRLTNAVRSYLPDIRLSGLRWNVLQGSHRPEMVSGMQGEGTCRLQGGAAEENRHRFHWHYSHLQELRQGIRQGPQASASLRSLLGLEHGGQAARVH